MAKMLSRRVLVGYGIGDLSNGLTFGMSSTFLLAFYTDVLGITAVAAGTLFLVARMIDAITDPLMGAFADRMFQGRMKRAGTPRIEKFRPFILYGSVPVVIASVVLFMAPEELTTDQKLIWAYATYILWGMAYTFVNIPYGSLATVMTQDPVERSKLSAARGVGGAFGAVIDRVIVPLFLVAYADSEAQGYLYSMATLGVIAVLGYLVCYFTVSENVQTTQDLDVKFTFRGTFGVLWKNRPFIAVSGASLAMIGGFMVSGTMTIYYFRENLDALNMMGLSGLTVIGPILLSAPLIPRLIARFGVKNTVSVSSLIGCMLYTILLLLPSNVYIYLIGTFISAICLTIPMMSLWGMVSDSIDYNQYLSGVRQEGVIYGAYSFVRKTAQALAGFVAGSGLSIAGYSATAETQSAETLAGIKFLALGTPAIGLLIASLIFHWLWNLTPEKQKEVSEAISVSST